MKTLLLVPTIAASLMFAASCNNITSMNTKAETKDTIVKMSQDTSKFTLNMVDNKKDFVCRMPLTAGIEDTVHYKGKVYGFCSKGCKDSFLENPESYLAEKK